MQKSLLMDQLCWLPKLRAVFWASLFFISLLNLRPIQAQTHPNDTDVVKLSTNEKDFSIDDNKKYISLEKRFTPSGNSVSLKGKSSLEASLSGHKNPAGLASAAGAEQLEISISGRVFTSDDPLGFPGVTVRVKNSDIVTVTDIDGNFTIKVPDENATLIFSFVGYESQEIAVSGRSTITVELKENLEGLEEVVVVGFGTQKKESVVGAMTSVNPSELKIPSSNLTTSLAGRVAGLVSYQTSGEPGADNAQFFVRGVASFNNQNGPLILIDGVELTVDDLARLQPDDIESFAVLKDPTTTAIYGARGANGIILVTTKTGVEGPAVVNLRIESSFSSPTQLVELADPVTHMRLQNEANRTRGDFPTFSEEQIAGTIRGGNPNIYPVTDWYNTLFKDYANTSRINLNVRGGGPKVRYYVAGSLNKDNGLLKADNTNNFTNGINLKKYLLRSNVNIDLHKNTEMIVRLHSTIDDYRGPLQGGNAIYNAAVRTSPTRFRAVYDADPSLEGVPHILFGNGLPPRGIGGGGDDSSNPVWFNPYAELQRGYRDTRRQLSLVQLEFKQKLDSFTPGLSARVLGNVNTTSFFENKRSYSPYFYRVSTFDPNTEDYSLIRTALGSGDESLELQPGQRLNNSVLYMESAVNYNRTFNKHTVGGLVVVIAREYLDGNANTVQLSLPSRNLGISGRYNYDYDNKYFAEFNFGYNGSERFAEDNRFGFFPSVGVGWLISNENFMRDNPGIVSRLKLRASYGFVGNDQIGDTRNDRFFYLSEVNLNNGSRGATFGRELNQSLPGVSITRYANPLVTWELAEKLNIGFEMNLFDDAVQFRLDAFKENRSSILQSRADIPSTLGLQAELKTNVGVVDAQGIDASIDINHYFNNELWVLGRGTFTYADNEFMVYEEPNYAEIGAPWKSTIGNNVSVSQGYIAERLFVDDEEAVNSPTQFGAPGIDYGGGDIKYKDLNGDGVITELDMAPIGNPRIPKITYGMGFSAGYKRFDINVFFQGLSEVSFFINPMTTGPFINSVQEAGINASASGNGYLSENGLLQAYADSHWSEENRDIYAIWPRLSTGVIHNNTQTSTWWLRDGAFLRLKQLEIGYNLLKKPSNKLGMTNFRIYASGTNLYTWSVFDLWDPELGGNGLNYPLQRVINMGIHIGF
ncbi:SusC/RagA family TonB-linked outer membrane protein [Echinicola pacifica]|uniref:SusC/RagA family TonB-linked outer membrane protein n=1 Tax=Echinicola pacifica TaxID=346377 RepID=A0A918PKT5_9BACT|nr:TonB-dependent receptor [Echinicola pacifica]GGZ13519.1 SusC/RagA family TonB-linked outer membrane protein [Echinicola pacifica]